MKGKFAGSIIIKVGHGIMEIPRSKEHVSKPGNFLYDKAKSNDSNTSSHQMPKYGNKNNII